MLLGNTEDSIIQFGDNQKSSQMNPGRGELVKNIFTEINLEILD